MGQEMPQSDLIGAWHAACDVKNQFSLRSGYSGTSFDSAYGRLADGSLNPVRQGSVQDFVAGEALQV